jgi:hypothetical protein
VHEQAVLLPRALDKRLPPARVPLVDRGVRDDVRQACLEEPVEERDAGLGVLVRVPVLVPRLRPVRRRRRVIAGGVVHEVRRIGREQVRALAAHQSLDRVGARAVAAEQPVLAQDPEIAQPAGGVLRRLARSGVVQLLVRLVRGELGQKLVDLVVAEPDAVERVLGAEGVEQGGQGLIVPLGELSGPVVRDRVRRGLQVGAVEPGDGDLAEAQGLRSLEPRVARDHLAARLRDDGLPEAEASQRGGDVRDGWVVQPRVRGRAEESVDRDRLDGELRGRVQAQSSSSGARLGRKRLGLTRAARSDSMASGRLAPPPPHGIAILGHPRSPAGTSPA